MISSHLLTMYHNFQVKTLTSEELFELVNAARKQAGESPLNYHDLRERMLDELDGDENFRYENFIAKKVSNNERKVWTLTIEQCTYLSSKTS